MLLKDDGFFSQDDRVEVMSIKQSDNELHQHKFLEMVYITSGQALHTFGDTDTVVKKGDYFIINYGTEHKYTLDNNKPFNLVNILFKPALIDKSLQNCRSFQDLINHYLIRVSYSSLGKNPTGIIYHDKDSSVYNIVNKIQDEYSRKAPGHIEIIRCLIIELIIMTMRTISKNDSSVFTEDASDFIKGYIDKNYMNEITLSGIGKKLTLSTPYLSRKFKKDTGFTFIEYLQRKRMEQSGRLIANTDKKMSEIIELVGYSDVKFFTAVFKKHWGITPSDFRKAYR